MLCPRCNSENDLGEKFCRHCGAPLVDNELYMSDKEKKFREKERKKQEKLQRKNSSGISQQLQAKAQKKTYTLDEQAYRRDPTKMIMSLAKSLIVLLALIVLIYFGGGFLLKNISENIDNYHVAGTKVPSVNYVVGDRKIAKVSYSYDKGIKTQYKFENVEDTKTDLIKYIGYVMEHNKFEIASNFDPSQDNGTVKLIIKSDSKNTDNVVLMIEWTKTTYTLTFYKEKNILNDVK